MKYTPRPDTKALKTIVVLLSLCSLVFIGFGLAIGGFSADVLRALAIVPFCTAMLLTIRFGLYSYTYVLEDFEFIITQKIGNKTRTVCRLYYTDITEIITYDKAKDKIKGRKKYDYRVKILPQKFYCLFYEIGNENEVILLEPDENFVNALSKYIQDDILND